MPAAAPHPRDPAVLARLLQASDQELDEDGRDEDGGMEIDHEQDTNMGSPGSLDSSVDDYVHEILLQQLGSSGRSYRREARASCTRIVSEM